ncbi:MAG: hypothetical protein ACYCOS_07920 [Sulfobacillus sp.]
MARLVRLALLPLLLVLAGCSVYGVSIPPTSGPWLAVNPGTGLPGTVLAVSGGQVRVAADHRLVLCWNGCSHGLRIVVTSTAGGPNQATFSASLVVPTVPWLEASGPHPVTPGAYAVSATCLTSGGSCAQVHGYAKAVFNLLIRVPNLSCTKGHPCASLAVPSRPSLGGSFAVRGTAPLTGGNFGPGGYQVVATAGAQALPGQWIAKPPAASQALGRLAQTWQGTLSGQLTWPQALSGGQFTVWLVSPPFPGGHRLAVGVAVVTPSASAPAP